MKYLILCEGTNERTLINLLLDNHKLIFERSDLINEEVFHARQFVPYITSHVLAYNQKDIKVFRVGDKQTDKLKIPDVLKQLIYEKNIYKYCTRPELEILLIISQNQFSKYTKTKSKIKPKTFAKENIILNGKKYDCSCQFYENYYSKDIDRLVNDIKKCKKLTKNNQGEKYLADLLK